MEWVVAGCIISVTSAVVAGIVYCLPCKTVVKLSLGRKAA